MKGRGDKYDYSLTKVLVLAMLKGKLSDSNSCWDICHSTDLVGGSVYCLEYLAKISGIRYENLWAGEGEG